MSATHWCISRSCGHSLALLSLEGWVGVNSVGVAKRRADGVMSGWRECLGLICAAVLATAGLMLVLVSVWRLSRGCGQMVHFTQLTSNWPVARISRQVLALGWFGILISDSPNICIYVSVISFYLSINVFYQFLSWSNSINFICALHLNKKTKKQSKRWSHIVHSWFSVACPRH